MPHIAHRSLHDHYSRPPPPPQLEAAGYCNVMSPEHHQCDYSNLLFGDLILLGWRQFEAVKLVPLQTRYQEYRLQSTDMSLIALH